VAVRNVERIPQDVLRRTVFVLDPKYRLEPHPVVVFSLEAKDRPGKAGGAAFDRRPRLGDHLVEVLGMDAIHP